MNDKDFLENDVFPEEEYEGAYPEEALPAEDSYGDIPIEEYPEEVYTEEMLPEAPIHEEELYLDETPAQAHDGEDLFHDALVTPDTGDELTAADHAMYSAGLSHPEDLEYAEFTGDIPVDSTELSDEAHAGEVPGDAEEFHQMFEEKTEQAEEPVQPKKERPTRKGRPRRKKGYGLLGIPHLIAAAIWLMIIVAIGTSLGRIVWVCAADVLAFGRESKEVSISITTDDTMESIAAKLKNAGLIRYPELFKFYADLSDADEKITTGTFTLNTVYDYMALVNHMSPRSNNRAVIEDVLIPEGYSCRQIFALLEEKGICKAADLEEWAANGELDDYWFLEGVARGDKYCLEGFLFPDTYDFYENSTPKLALEKMLDGFDYRFTEEMQAQLPTLNARLTEMMRSNGENQEFIDSHQLSLRDLVTVASLIEEETASNSESAKIASVIYNRLFSWGDNPRYLNIDAAIFYALGYHKEALSAEDLQIDSPYNTYTHTGLVPGPISNPGLASLKAALNPEDTSYYYYVLDPEEGLHRFNKTYADHEKDRADIYGD